MNTKVKLGMIGGGPDAFIGAVHRMAAVLDHQIEIVSGCFSRNIEKSFETGAQLNIAKGRIYSTFEDMILKERELPDDSKIDAVAIVTPNHMHFEPAKLALENGFHVICDKPVTINSDEAQKLLEIVKEKQSVFALTHNYTGYPMVKQAKHLVKSGQLGNIRKVVVEYPQGWLATRIESSGQKQANWRTDPSKAGISCCIGDIGSHAENLSEYITGLKITEICADITTFLPGRNLDDDGNVLLRFENDAKGILHSSQVSIGEENNLNIRVYGDKGSLEWHQVEPNTLLVKHPDRPTEIYRSGGNYEFLCEHAKAHMRLPAGHPEGYLEAFANIYRNFAKAIQAKKAGAKLNLEMFDFPSIEDGLRGIFFIEKVVESSSSNQKWIKI